MDLSSKEYTPKKLQELSKVKLQSLCKTFEVPKYESKLTKDEIIDLIGKHRNRLLREADKEEMPVIPLTSQPFFLSPKDKEKPTPILKLGNVPKESNGKRKLTFEEPERPTKKTPTKATPSVTLIAEEELGTLMRRGGGATGVVLEGRWKGQAVAVKQYNEFTLDKVVFDLEVKAMSRVSHPNILPLLGRVSGKHWLVTPWMTDGSLFQRLYKSKNPLTNSQIREIALGIAKGLEFMHQQELIHRDLKPENILLSGTHAYLADFGSSKLLLDYTTLMGGDNSGVTPHYIPPETAMEEKPRWKKAGDVWAFGILLWEMMTKKRPYDEMKNPWKLASDIHGGRKPGEIPSSADPVFKSVVALCWKHKPEDRPKMSQIVKMLEGKSTDETKSVKKEKKVKKTEGSNEKKILTNQHFKALCSLNSVASLREIADRIDVNIPSKFKRDEVISALKGKIRYKDLLKADLASLCEELELMKSGNKDVLINRLNE